MTGLAERAPSVHADVVRGLVVAGCLFMNGCYLFHGWALPDVDAGPPPVPDAGDGTRGDAGAPPPPVAACLPGAVLVDLRAGGCTELALDFETISGCGASSAPFHGRFWALDLRYPEGGNVRWSYRITDGVDTPCPDDRPCCTHIETSLECRCMARSQTCVSDWRDFEGGGAVTNGSGAVLAALSADPGPSWAVEVCASE